MINSISLNGSVLTSEEAGGTQAQVAAANPVAEEPADRLGETAVEVPAEVVQTAAEPADEQQ